MLRLSLNRKYAAIRMNTVLSAMIAPHIPPFSPALSAPLKEMTEAYAPTNSRPPPMKM